MHEIVDNLYRPTLVKDYRYDEKRPCSLMYKHVRFQIDADSGCAMLSEAAIKRHHVTSHHPMDVCV